MRMWTKRAMPRWSLVLLMAFGIGAAGQAAAAPDLEGSESFVEPNGAYTVVKTFEVYSEANPDNPSPVVGNYTYVYTLTNDAGSFVSILGFDLEAPAGSITGARNLPTTLRHRVSVFTEPLLAPPALLSAG